MTAQEPSATSAPPMSKHPHVRKAHIRNACETYTNFVPEQSVFPILSLLPQRALCCVKEAHPQDFINVFLDLYREMWENGKDVSKPDVFVEVLMARFEESTIKDIMEKANSVSYKQRLNDNTKEALDRGAFGCPWYFVRNSKGQEEPFFGSDRYVPI